MTRIISHHLQELEASAIAPDVSAVNIASFGPGTDRHWEVERAELLRHKRLEIETQSVTDKGDPQGQAGHLFARLIALDNRYRHLQAGGWRTLSASLPGLESFDQWKPDAPRSDHQKPEKCLKYETPPAFPGGGGLLLPHVPERCWRLICQRHGIPFPKASTVAGGFWPWARKTAKLPILVCEGWKKALAAISAGHAAVAVPGITMGWRGNRNTGRQLIPALQALACKGRPWIVVFDTESKESTARKVAAASGTLAQLLRHRGGKPSIARLPLLPGRQKIGLDDLLVAAGAEALDGALAAASPPPTLQPALPQLRRPDLIASTRFLGQSITIPTDRRVVALAPGMGTGKTELIAAYVAPLLQEGVRVVQISHRRSLGATLAAKLGLPWADEAAPGCDLRQTGIALCIDSLCPSSRLRFNPRDWAGAVVVIDEATAVLAHAVMATETAIGRRRVAVLQALEDLLAHARQVLIADAQLDDATLQTIEAAAGDRALLIGSAHKPAAGRRLIQHESRGAWYETLTACLDRRERLWISTTAAEADCANSAQNIAVLVRRHWPDARVLVVDRDTVADSSDDAHRLATDPDGVAAAYDCVVATPAVAAGLSVTLKDHFAAVFVAAGGTTDPGAVAQAAGRVRDAVPRHLFAPDRSPGDALRIGCGSIDPDQVMLHLAHHHHVVVGQLAAAGLNIERQSTGPWLPHWAQLAAQQNRARLTFDRTVAGLLQLEGYILEAGPKVPGAITPKVLTDLAEMEKEGQWDDIAAADLLTDEQARKLQERRGRLSKIERAQLQRWRIDRAWGLKGAPPSVGLIKAHENGHHHRVIFRWAVTDPAAAPMVAAHDRHHAQQQAPHGRGWAPDLTATNMGSRVALAQALGLANWLKRSDWFADDDSALMDLVEKLDKPAATGAICQTLRVSIKEALGLEDGVREVTLLRQLLQLAGAKLVAERRRSGKGQRGYLYRVAWDRLPDGISPDQVVTAWQANYGGGWPKISPIEREKDPFWARPGSDQVDRGHAPPPRPPHRSRRIRCGQASRRWAHRVVPAPNG